MRIFLADLGHNQLTISSDVYPLGVANLATYIHAHLPGRRELDVTVYREPQDLKAALDRTAPDVLALSSYSWNHNLSLHYARYARALYPGVLTLMGGPNYPLTNEEKESFLREMPEIDIAVRGPTYEGERAFRNIVQRFSECGLRKEGLFEAPVPGNDWIDRRTGQFVLGADLERILDLDEIPSPYLQGWMDPYFQSGYFPMMQINRGCPFSCTFCNSSVKSNSKVYGHSMENVKADLLYIAERVRKEIPLCFADDNFGMYPVDEEVADYMAWLQDNYGWPNYIRTTTGKNRAERIIGVMRKLRGRLPMTAAVQSMNPKVLLNIERSNIRLDTYAQIQKEVLAQGMQSYGEMILCLPGESKATFMQGVKDLLRTGVKRLSAHQLMLLHGAPLSNPESRKRFGFRTRFRVVARNIGNYTGEPVIETEEMVVETPDFSFQDYLDTRVFHLLMTIFYYEGNFDEAFAFADQHGVEPFDLLVRMQAMLDEAPAAFRAVIDDFLRESQEELFPTRAECVAWALEHFPKLVDGSLGGNLLSKYSMLGRFYVTQEALSYLEHGIRTIFEDRGLVLQPSELANVIEYLRSVLLHVPFAETLAKTPAGETGYDIQAWSGENYTRPLAAYRFESPRKFTTLVEPEKTAAIQTRIATFGEHPSGLGKFTRTMFARDLRRTLRYSPVQAEVQAA
jgi:radical SAM superfamily enzyme YgiQ (UPF0313 family)